MKKDHVINLKLLTLFLFLLYSLLIFGYVKTSSDLPPLTVSFISVFSILFSICFLIINKIDKTSIIYLFVFALSVFIFGRFFAVVLSEVLPNGIIIDNSNDLFKVTWMTSFYPSLKDQRILLLIVNYFCLFLTLGFILGTDSGFKRNNKPDIEMINKILLISKFIFVTSLIYRFYFLVKTLSLIQLVGYGGVYAESSGSTIVNTLFFISFAYIMIYEPSNRKYLIASLVFFFFSGLTGGRGTLVTGLLTLFYIYYRQEGKRLNIGKLSICLIFIYISMKLIFSLSARSDLSSESNINGLIEFLYHQGISLSVVGFSLFSDLQYPLHTLLQSFIPMTFKFYRLFETDVDLYAGSITTYLSYHANPGMFKSGAGLGSSILSEIYIFSFYNIFIFTFISFLIGLVIKKVELKSKYNHAYAVYLFSIVPFLLFSPRNGLNVLIITSIYIFIVMKLINFITIKSNQL